MKIAVEGCCHGELDKIYAALEELEMRENILIDLLIICGDFQAVRNYEDLECMAVPPKYRRMGTFYKYYSGQVKAPYLTIFIGGNHEASNHLWELYYGGWVAPNIYYLGHSGVVNFGGLRIAGLSGIYNSRHYKYGHYEFPPYSRDTLRSVYHIREFEVRKLLKLKKGVDIFLSHDWPRGVANCGFCDKGKLLRKKPYFAEEIRRDQFGSPAGAQLCNRLKPKYWFSAHHHVKFEASIHHKNSISEFTLRVNDVCKVADNDETRFLALDKCLPGRNFLQVIDFPDATGTKKLEYDEEWLAIVKKTHHEMSLDRKVHVHNTQANLCEGVSTEDISWITQRMQYEKKFIPDNFTAVAPVYNPSTRNKSEYIAPHYRNPQTMALLELLELPYLLNRNASTKDLKEKNPEEIEIAHNDDEALQVTTTVDKKVTVDNPEEIDI